MSSLSSYLAKNYLTASNTASSDLSDRPKKRRKKEKSTTEPQSLVVNDDDELLLSGHTGPNGRNNEDEDGPQMYEGNVKSAEFRKKKQSTWKTIAAGDGAGTGPSKDTAGQDEADKILRAAADAEDDRRREVEMEDAPAIVDDAAISTEVPETDSNKPRMQTGGRAGLQTAADTAALVEREKRERRAEEKRLRRERKNQPEEETIYRDATGRRIDVSLRRAEARKAQQEEERRKKQEREDAMGDVQRQAKEERKQELEDAKFLTLGRDAEDEEMNERMKAEVRWDDPMAAYMLQKQAEEAVVEKSGAGGGKVATGKAAASKKTYQGAAPPNRYGIKPGWRWDGVDRGNGFEKEWFQARSRKSRNEELSYQWAMDE